ncbi:M50 family metallopeptidase [Halobacteriaceae archaeon GCM10025711]
MRSFKIGSVFGIPIRLDITFLIILPVFAWIIGSQVNLWVGQIESLWGITLDAGPLTAGSMQWILGTAAALGLFLGVVLHELGHSVVAMRFGFPIDSITLWILGGIAQLSDQPEDWKQELLIAIAGPFVSIVLGVVSYVALVSLPASLDAARFVFGYLALMNFALAAFNLLPGFPMDGGRVLRALLARTRSFARATQIAAEVGKYFAFLLGLLGLFAGNIILIGVAFFIYIGASGEAQQTVMNAAFEDVSVSDIMTPAADLKTIEADASIADLLDQMFSQRHTGYPVTRNGELVGMVTLDDAREVSPVERDAYRVEDVMSTDLKTIPADSNAMDALERMQRNRIGRLVVTENGDVAGLISRTDLVTAFDIIKSSGPRGSSAREPTRSDQPEPYVRNRE